MEGNYLHTVSVESTFGLTLENQIIIYPDGAIDINIREIVGEYSATVGIQNSTGLVATQIDVYNGNYFENNTSYRILKAFVPTDWLSLSSSDGLSGELLNGQYKRNAIL